MQTRTILLGVFSSVLSAGLVMLACGGSSDDTTTTSADAGSEAAVDAAKDTGPVVEEDAATCDLSYDFTKDIPDASIADGASTSAACVACAKAKCAENVKDCTQNCECQGIAADAIDCYLKSPGNPLLCAADFVSVSKETRDIGIALFGCLSSSCKTECATDQIINDGGAD